MDHGGEALIGLVGAHSDAFELPEPFEEVVNEMLPFVHFLVDGEEPCTTGTLRDDDIGAALGDNGAAIEGLVGDQRVEGQCSTRGGTTVSKGSLGRSRKRMRLPSASVSAGILGHAASQRPIAWL
ncbi:hypothetical protein XH98_08600 [Bradyrhizobium sp. CCBAU 51745]|nr:hypothetical protein [Bradyrhizobium sp. CCBAU 51745]